MRLDVDREDVTAAVGYGQQPSDDLVRRTDHVLIAHSDGRPARRVSDVVDESLGRRLIGQDEHAGRAFKIDTSQALVRVNPFSLHCFIAAGRTP